MTSVPLIQWPPPEDDPFDEPQLETDVDVSGPDDNWPPRELDVDAAPPPKAKPTPKPRPSPYMEALQKVVDESTDEQIRVLRAGGCDLLPVRWAGVVPPGMPERPGST